MQVPDSLPFGGDYVDTMPVDIVAAPTPPPSVVPTSVTPSPSTSERRDLYQHKRPQRHDEHFTSSDEEFWGLRKVAAFSFFGK